MVAAAFNMRAQGTLLIIPPQQARHHSFIRASPSTRPPRYGNGAGGMIAVISKSFEMIDVF